MVDIQALFQPFWDKAAASTQGFNHPDSRSLIIVRRLPNWPNEYLEIDPPPLIETVSPRLAATYERIGTVQLETTDFRVSGISARYTREQLVGRGIHYLIDAEMVGGEPVGGREADQVAGTQIERTSHLAWQLLLRCKPSPTLGKF